MATNTAEYSPHDHGDYSHRPKYGVHFPAIPPDHLISFISLFEFYAHASFSSGDWHSRMATLFLGVGLLKLNLDNGTATTLH